MNTHAAADSAAKTTELPLPRTPARSEQTYEATSRRRRPPGTSRLRAFLRALRTSVVVLVLLAAAVAGGVYIARDRLAAREYVELGDAVVSAEPVPVGSAAAGTVESVKVSPQSEISAGDDLAEVTVVAPDGEPETQVLKAPVDGVVSEVDAPAGGVVTAGQPVVTLYDPAKLSFHADASIEELRKLRLGMAAGITAEGLDDPISARLDRVVPRVGDEEASGEFTVVLTPEQDERETVRKLVPGLPFTAKIDTRTAADGTPAINSAR